MERLGARVPVKALSDIAEFLAAAEQLKSLLLWREQLRNRDSGVLRSLDRQIVAIRAVCLECAERNRRIADLWHQAEEELSQYMEEPSHGQAS